MNSECRIPVNGEPIDIADECWMPKKMGKHEDVTCRRFQFSSFYKLHVCWFLFATALLPSNMSIPINQGTSEVDSSKPHWVNPCPGVVEAGDRKESSVPDREFINSISLTAKVGKVQAENFANNYVSNVFQTDLKTHHSKWKNSNLDWLQNGFPIPKELGQSVSQTHLESIDLESESLKIYGYLQRLAVAFEQVVKDHRDQNTEFKEEFAKAETNLKEILCELRELIPDSKLSGFKDATRDIMAPEYRHMTQAHQRMRDWMIFRDYLNLLEYIIEVMQYFAAKTI